MVLAGRTISRHAFTIRCAHLQCHLKHFRVACRWAQIQWLSAGHFTRVFPPFDTLLICSINQRGLKLSITGVFCLHWFMYKRTANSTVTQILPSERHPYQRQEDATKWLGCLTQCPASSTALQSTTASRIVTLSSAICTGTEEHTSQEAAISNRSTGTLEKGGEKKKKEEKPYVAVSIRNHRLRWQKITFPLHFHIYHFLPFSKTYSKYRNYLNLYEQEMLRIFTVSTLFSPGKI